MPQIDPPKKRLRTGIGIAAHPEGGLDIDTLLDNARNAARAAAGHPSGKRVVVAYGTDAVDGPDEP